MVKERVGLYLWSSFGPLWHVLGWTLPFTRSSSGYGLKDFGGFISGGCRGFSLHCHSHVGSVTHPVSSLMGYWGAFLEVMQTAWSWRHHFGKWEWECIPLVCSRGVVFDKKDGFIYHLYKYSWVSFYDGSLLRPLSRRTELSLLLVHRCRNSSVLLALLQYACDFFFFYFGAVLLSKCLRFIGNFPRRTPIPRLHTTLNDTPIRDFIYHLTANFFDRCPAHPNLLVRSKGNYSLADLHRQYKKYIHKCPKHILF